MLAGVRSTPLIEDRLIEIIRKEPELVALVGMGTVAVLLVLTAFILICFLDARRRLAKVKVIQTGHLCRLYMTIKNKM